MHTLNTTAMPIIGKIIKTGVSIGYKVIHFPKAPLKAQENVLRKLLSTAQNTQFGQHYQFHNLLKSGNLLQDFRQTVPVFDYDMLYRQWWHQYQSGAENVTWPGAIRYFALSSGTSTGSSKYIPVSNQMLTTMKQVAVRHILSMAQYPLPDDFWEKQILMLGGSTNLKWHNHFYVGDLSGITAAKLPVWFRQFYRPGAQIAQTDDWFARLDQIAREAPTWDIGAITGIPSWMRLLLQHIIQEHKLKTIHDIWPNLRVMVHGGIAFEPYKKAMQELFGKPVWFIDTYPASEGYIAHQNRPDTHAMQLILDKGLFFEFVPFTDTNFNANGEILPNAQTLLINEVQPHTDYALLLSTCSGAWRYLIGDTVKFTDTQRCELLVTGRTKHFLSLCGEHLSVDNMNHAVEQLETELNTHFPEFTVAGAEFENAYAHHWYLGTDNPPQAANLPQLLDTYLKTLNDDYATERNTQVIKTITVTLLPTAAFYGWMQEQGKMGGQHKFPRVLKGQTYQSWLQFIEPWLTKQ